MHDVAIVGAGLCGLALAETLEAEGRSVVLVEARSRLGGRVLSARGGAGIPAFDLGAGWFWPDRQPLIAALLERLGIASLPQHDSGTNLALVDPDKGPRPQGAQPVHGGARRVAGGMGQLVEALAGRLAETQLMLGSTVQAIVDDGACVRLVIAGAEGGSEIVARRCVLALPPRLVASLTFSPTLDGATLSALQQVPTWMATAAKVAMACARPVWRDAGLSGSAFVSHEQAVLSEVWDACDEDAAVAGLGGFVALTPEQRRAFATGLPMLVTNQAVQLFGPSLEAQAPLIQDWSNEAFTCSAADLAQAPPDHPVLADSLLRAPRWSNRLFLAGAETAAREPGYLEGALDSAQRAAAQIGQAERLAQLMSEPVNGPSIGAFGRWLDGKRDSAFADYRRTMARAMMRQDREQLTQRALLGAVEAVFAEALTVLETLPFAAASAGVDQGRSNLLPLLQAPFKPFLDGLIDEAFAFNASSCALSNFPDEHRPPRDYRNAMLRDIAAAWVEFSQAANDRLVATAGPRARAGEG